MKKRLISLFLAALMCTASMCMIGAAEAEPEIEIRWVDLPGELDGKPEAYNPELGWVTFSGPSGGNFVLDLETGELVSGIKYCAAPSEGLSRVSVGNKVGYVDSEGNMVIPAEYIGAYDFSDGLALVMKLDNNKGSVAYIDTEGNEVIPFGEYDRGQPFSEGLAAVAKYDEETERLKWGFIDTKGNVKIPFEFDGGFDRGSYYVPWGFKEGVCPMGQMDADGQYKWGAINKKGETVVSFDNQFISCFDSGLARAVYNDNSNAIDTTGHVVIPEDKSNWSCCDYPGNGLIPTCDESSGKYGFINKLGDIVIPFKYDAFYGYFNYIGFRDGIALVQIMNSAELPQYGFINTTGKEIVPVEYDEAGNLGAGGWVRKGDRYGVFDNPYWGQKTPKTSEENNLILISAVAAVVVALIAIAAVIVVKRRKKARSAAGNFVSQEAAPVPAHMQVEHNFCMACGSPLPEGCRFCPKCGKEV